jgi:hypothetical protein
MGGPGSGKPAGYGSGKYKQKVSMDVVKTIVADMKNNDLKGWSADRIAKEYRLAKVDAKAVAKRVK